MTAPQSEETIPPSMTTLSKTPTYIQGLDEILQGGLPAGRPTLISGGPGCGKTILGLEFVVRGALHGEPGIFISFEEPATAVRQDAATLGMDLASLEAAGKLFLYAPRVDPSMVRSGDFDLGGLLAIVDGKAREMGAQRVVLDALDMLLHLYYDPVRARTELYALNDWLRDHAMTAVLTTKTIPGRQSLSSADFLDFIVDCAIHLNQQVIDQVTTRRLIVTKYRGSAHGHNEYPFIITANGFSVSPMSTVALRHKPLGPHISSGNTRLDRVLGGGYRRAASILISGTTGSGKTSFAALFARAACQRGERVLYIDFEESQAAMVENLLSQDIDLRPALKAGALRFLTAMPEAMGAEEHLERARRTILAFEPHHVIVDAISACSRMGTEQAAFEYIVRLLYICKERGITTILTNQTEGFQNVTEISGIGISSLVDTLIFLRLVEASGELNRMLVVVKSRGSRHSNQYREFLITDRGVELLDVYTGPGGVLTGMARQEQEAREALARQRAQATVEHQAREVERLRAAVAAENARGQAELVAAELELARLRLEQEVAEQNRERRSRMRGEDAHSAGQTADRDTGGAT